MKECEATIWMKMTYIYFKISSKEYLNNERKFDSKMFLDEEEGEYAVKSVKLMNIMKVVDKIKY